MWKTGETKSGGQSKSSAPACEMSRSPKTSAIANYRWVVLPPQTNAILARNTHKASRSSIDRREARKLTVFRCSAARKHRDTVEYTHRGDRNDLTSMETSQVFPLMAVQPPSCAAAQRGNASERKAFVDSEAPTQQKGRAERAVHESAAGRIVQ